MSTSNDAHRAELIAQFIAAGQTLYERGYASGAAGNMSQLLPDGTVVATPTGSCLGKLKADELSLVDQQGNLLSGPKATKEVLFHLAIYRNNPEVKSVVHLHCCYCTAYACLKDLDPNNAIRPITPYVVMRMGQVPLIPYYKPGAIHLAEDIGQVAAGHKAFLMANHGMITCGKDMTEAVNNAEELEAACQTYFLLQGQAERIRYLTADEIAELMPH